MIDDLKGVIWHFMDARTVLGYGPWVRAADYKALEAQLAEARTTIAGLRAQTTRFMSDGEDCTKAAVAAALEEACDVLQEAVDDWRSTGNELPARKIEDEIPHIRALIPQSGADALERARAVAVKPLDLSHLLKHAFISGRHSAGADDFENCFDEAIKAWTEYDPEPCVAYGRIRSALVHVTPDMLAQARADGMREAVKAIGGLVDPENRDAVLRRLAAIEKGEG